MNKQKHIAFLIALLIITIVMGISDVSASTTLPKSGNGIWVNVIGNHGILTGTNVSIYFLNEDEYSSYKKSEGFELQHKGKPPIFFENVIHGKYYVGIEMIIDKYKIKNEETEDFLGQKAIHPLPEESYVDDVPYEMSWGLKVVKGEIEWYLIKWYEVFVEHESIYPVVSLFLNKEGIVSDWEKYYPPTEQFKIAMQQDLLNKFWSKLDESGSKTTPQERIHLIKLLKKGGVAVLPGNKSVSVIFVKEDGTLIAKAPVQASNKEILIPQNTNSMNKGVSEIQQTSVMPPFSSKLEGHNEVRIKNPNEFEVMVGLRSGHSGNDFGVEANSAASVFVPNGKYEIYFVYSNKPDALFRGDDFTLNDNGVEIQIVKVVGGNYGIRQVK